MLVPLLNFSSVSPRHDWESGGTFKIFLGLCISLSILSISSSIEQLYSISNGTRSILGDKEHFGVLGGGDGEKCSENG